MLKYVCLLYLATAAYAQGQQVPTPMGGSGIAMPSIPAGASALGQVAASTGQPQPQQQGIPVLGGAVNGPTFFQQSTPFGANPMLVGAQPVMTAQQPVVGSPVPPPSAGPLASLAAQQTLANSLVSNRGPSAGFNPLLLALGGNDNMLPYLLMSQPGLFQKNPLMGMMMMSNM